MKKHEIQQALAKAADELTQIAAKSAADGFSQELYDALAEKIVDLKKQLGRVEEAEKIAAALAQPSFGQERLIPLAPRSAHVLYGKLKNFTDREIDGNMVRAIDQAYASGQWFLATCFGKHSAIEWCKQHGISIEKAQGEGVNQAGGFLVPDVLANAIIVLREEFGMLRKLCQVVPMGSDTLNWPRRAGGLTAYWVGENSGISESQAKWDSVNLTPKKLAALVRMSTEIAEDAVINIGDWLAGEIAYAFAYAEDNAGLNGDGTSTYGGQRGALWLMSNAAGKGGLTGGNYTTSSATLTSLTVADFTGVMGKLPRYAQPNAKWIMSQQMFFTAAGTVLAKGGGNTIATLTQTLQERLLGFPVQIAQAMPISAPGTGEVQYLFGDFGKAAMMGERRGITIMRSDQRYFENDQIAIRGTERVHINVHDVGATASVSTNTAGSPLVAAQSP